MISSLFSSAHLVRVYACPWCGRDVYRRVVETPPPCVCGEDLAEVPFRLVATSMARVRVGPQRPAKEEFWGYLRCAALAVTICVLVVGLAAAVAGLGWAILG